MTTIDTMTIAKQAAEAVFQAIERHGIVMDHVVTAIHDKLAGAMAVSGARTEPYKAMIRVSDCTKLVDDVPPDGAILREADARIERTNAFYERYKGVIKGFSTDAMIIDDPALDRLRTLAEEKNMVAVREAVRRSEREFAMKMLNGGFTKEAVNSVVDFMKRNHGNLPPYQVAAIKALERSADGNVPTDHDPGDRRDRP